MKVFGTVDEVLVTGIDGFTVGDRVTVAEHTHAFGDCFLAGEGTVQGNPDFIAREKGYLIIKFDSGITGRIDRGAHPTVIVIR